MADHYSDAHETTEWNRLVNDGHTPLQPGLKVANKKDSKKSTRSEGYNGKHKKDKFRPSSREVAIVN